MDYFVAHTGAPCSYWRCRRESVTSLRSIFDRLEPNRERRFCDRHARRKLRFGNWYPV